MKQLFIFILLIPGVLLLVVALALLALPIWLFEGTVRHPDHGF